MVISFEDIEAEEAEKPEPSNANEGGEEYLFSGIFGSLEEEPELRRKKNGFWQHKHPGDGYDYWHPEDRVHKIKK